MTARLDWRGDQVLDHVEHATARAINMVTEKAAGNARGSHWWQSRSGQLEAEIVNEPAQRVGRRRILGRFGSTQRRGFVGLFHERRTPFLRPAADEEFPSLASEIRRRLR